MESITAGIRSGSVEPESAKYSTAQRRTDDSGWRMAALI